MLHRTVATANHFVPQLQDVVEWRPGRSEAIIWNAVGVAVTVVALLGFAMPSIFRGRAGGLVRVSLLDVVLVVAITLLLVIAHEAIHGMVMLGFGGRPRFGATLVGRVLLAIYATGIGHRFTRSQYVAVAVAPGLFV